MTEQAARAQIVHNGVMNPDRTLAGAGCHPAPRKETAYRDIRDLIGAGKSADALTLAREALLARRKLELSYAKADGAATKRTVRPLGSFSGAVDAGRLVRIASGFPEPPA